MALTNQEYNRLQRLHREEFFEVRRTQKVRVLSRYLSQATDLIGIISRADDTVFTSSADALSFFGRVDITVVAWNSELLGTLVASENQFIDLSADQALDLINMAGLRFEFGTEYFDNSKKLIADNRGKFRLSEAIWGEEKRDDIYNRVLKGIEGGKPKAEIITMLEDQLTKSGNGGQFYKVTRVLDTEYNNAYNISKLESSRQWNSLGSDRILYGRRLSPAHKVQDACDDLVGVYDPVIKTPQNPHPSCTCETYQVFESDHDGRIRGINGLSEITNLV